MSLLNAYRTTGYTQFHLAKNLLFSMLNIISLKRENYVEQICMQDHHKLTMFKLLAIVIFNAKPSIHIVVGDISETNIDSH